MALFTDQFVSGIENLLDYESNLPEVAAAEAIHLSAKLQLAQVEVGAQLEAASRRPGNVYFASGAGWNSTGGDAHLPQFALSQVVVTPPLKLWHTFQTLAIVYRDAYNRKLNDKYLPKWNEYRDLAKWAADLLFQTGIGLTRNPTPRPPPPALDWVSSSLPAMTLFVRMTGVNSQGAEGAGSEEQGVQVPENQALRVTPGPFAEGIEGWHVYAGEASGELTRQNSALLDPSEVWVMPESGLVAGEPLGDGQQPEYFKTVPRFLFRG